MAWKRRDVQLVAMVTKDEVQSLDQMAHDLEVSRAEVIRRAVKDYVDKHETDTSDRP